MSDCTAIRGLRVETVIGVWEWERQVTQTLLVDVDLYRDTRACGAGDDLDAALDYSKAAQLITEHIQSAQARLIERVANEVATLLLETFDLEKVAVTVHKPGALSAASDTFVRIVREHPAKSAH